jgi:hypothetical protein
MYYKRIEFLRQFSDYLLCEYGVNIHTQWIAVLQNRYPDSTYLFQRVAKDDEAWIEACEAFGNLTSH